MSLPAFFHDPFFLMALWASLFASFASGAIGSFVVVKRIGFIAGSISHSVLGGIGFSVWARQTGYLPWLDPLIGAFLAAIGSALLIGWIHLRYRQREDAVIAAIWTAGMAMGMIFLSLAPGSNSELLHVLLGNILWTTPRDLWLLGALDGLLFLAVFLFYRKFIALCFDEEQALLRGVPVQRLYLLLLSLVGISIVLLIQVIGAILVLALLILPPTIASLFTSKFKILILLSALISAGASFLGLTVSYLVDWPPGATIALLSALGYFSLLPFRRGSRKQPLANLSFHRL